MLGLDYSRNLNPCNLLDLSILVFLVWKTLFAILTVLSVTFVESQYSVPIYIFPFFLKDNSYNDRPTRLTIETLYFTPREYAVLDIEILVKAYV